MAVAMLKSYFYLYFGVLYIWINILSFLNEDDSFCYQRKKNAATWAAWILLGLCLNLCILVDCKFLRIKWKCILLPLVVGVLIILFKQAQKVKMKINEWY